MTKQNDEPPLWLLAIFIILTILAVLLIFLTARKEPETKLLPDIGLRDCVLEQPMTPTSPSYTILACLTAYNALPEQTDSTPFITASGERVREGIVANNGLPFGTIVEIDGKRYVVDDRMNRRYGANHFDIFKWDYSEARRFGRQYQRVVVYK